MVRDDVRGFIKPELGQRGQDAAFAGNAGGQNDIKRGNSVCCDHEQRIAEVVHIAHFSLNEL